MGTTCYSPLSHHSHLQPLFKLPSLSLLNSYSSPSSTLQLQDPKITTNSSAYLKFQDLISYFSLTGTQFQDINFKLNTDNARLSNLDRRYMKPVLLDNPHPNDQYTYLAAIFCYIADNREYFKGIFCSNFNQYSLYIVRMYPNGEQMFVAVDNYVPIRKENISYSSSKKAEIWMCILEKAWVKLVGGYDQARALSPQDAMEQILGIPAYSYQLQRMDKQIENAIRKNKQQQCCILFIAKTSAQELKLNLFPRQVFYLQGINIIQTKQFFRLISPYDNFSWNKSQLSTLQGQTARKYQQQERQNKNTIFLTQDEIYNYFEFCTFGYFIPGYISRSKQLQWDKEQGIKYIKMRVDREEQINIRISQFYQGYVRENINYSYSSVYIRLWNLKSKHLISQGCRRSPYSVKSSNLFPQCFQRLSPGQYLLSIDIPWKFPNKLSSCNLVTYSKTQIKFQQLLTSSGYMIQQQLLIHSIPYQQINRETLFEYAIHWKRNSVFLFVSNRKEDGGLKLRVRLGNSVNLEPIGYEFEGKEVMVEMGVEGRKIVEFRKKEVERTGQLGSFTFEVV